MDFNQKIVEINQNLTSINFENQSDFEVIVRFQIGLNSTFEFGFLGIRIADNLIWEP